MEILSASDLPVTERIQFLVGVFKTGPSPCGAVRVIKKFVSL
jgi:hypothetical protein